MPDGDRSLVNVAERGPSKASTRIAPSTLSVMQIGTTIQLVDRRIFRTVDAEFDGPERATEIQFMPTMRF